MSAAAFRRARADEATALSKVARETFVEKFGHLYRRRDLDAFLDKSHAPKVYARLLADPDHALWVVEAPDGGLDGYLVTGPCDLPAPPLPTENPSMRSSREASASESESRLSRTTCWAAVSSARTCTST